MAVSHHKSTTFKNGQNKFCVLCPNLTNTLHKEVSQIANDKLSITIVQGGFSKNLKPHESDTLMFDLP